MPQELISIGLPIALILIMFGVGLNLTAQNFTFVLKYPRSFLIGAICQLLLLPIIAIIVIYITGLKNELAIGLFIIAICPGGVTSNLYSYLSKGDVELSVALTTVIGFITPFTIPFLIIWAINFYLGQDSDFSLPVIKTWIQLIAVTVIPVMLGMLVKNKWSSFAIKFKPYVGIFSVLVLAAVIASICMQLGMKVFDFVKIIGIPVLVLNIITMGLGYVIAKSMLNNKAQARTITLEVGLQNGTIALLITSAILENNIMSIAPSIYSLLMFITATLFTIFVLQRDKLTNS